VKSFPYSLSVYKISNKIPCFLTIKLLTGRSILSIIYPETRKKGAGFLKQQRKTALTQERILHASMLEFRKKGYAQATISEICSTGNVPKGLIYHNFKGKDELYLLSLKKVYDDFIDYLADIEEPLTMQQYMQRRLSFFSDHPMYARLFFESILHPPEQ